MNKMKLVLKNDEVSIEIGLLVFHLIFQFNDKKYIYIFFKPLERNLKKNLELHPPLILFCIFPRRRKTVLLFLMIYDIILGYSSAS